MEITEKMVEEMKDLSRKHGKEYTDGEAREAAWNLIRYVELVWEIATRETQRKQRLKKEPEGFPVDGSYSCIVCGGAINSETGWYDKYGAKCLLCQKAVKDGVIPTYVCLNHDSYFSIWKLSNDWKVKTVTIRKFVREGKIKARIVLNNEGKPHVYIFLRKENPNIVQPNNPARKPYDRYHKKRDRRWAKEKAKEWKLEKIKNK